MKPFATCDLCDANKNASGTGFRVLPPVFRDFGARRSFCAAGDDGQVF